MSNLTTAFVIVLFVNVMLFLGQITILELNPDGTVFYSCEGGILGEFEKNDCTGETLELDDSRSASILPTGEGSISPTTGNVFTDIFGAAKDWITTTTGLKYLATVLSAPYNFLQAAKLPQAFVFAVGTLWYALTLFLLIAFILGRDA